MDLFPINRYVGEDQENQESPNEIELRKKLLKKIKKRKSLNESFKEINIKKRKSEVLNNDNTTEESFQEFDHKKKTKIKSVKQEADESVDGEKPQRKVKKIKGESNLNDSTVTTDSVDLISRKSSDENEEESDQEKEDKIKDQTAFTILKDVNISKKNKVKRKLPNWLANPSVVSVDLKNLTCKIDSFPQLDKIFIDKLRAQKISHFFPVQQQIIPYLLENENRPHMYWPQDICVSAPTGSGKTLAFVLPILQVLHKRIVPRIRALVVLPVQDLANQVFKVFETYSSSTSLKILLLSKLCSFEQEQKLIREIDDFGKYRTLVDILVTTPGRLVEHLTKTEGLDLSDLRYLVIDEADRVMEKVQNDWLYHLSKHIYTECTKAYQVPIITYNNMITHKRPPNKLLFSATLSQDPEKLQQLGLFHPKLFTSVVKSENQELTDFQDETKFVGKYTTPAELTELYTECTKANKPLILYHLMQTKFWKNILCFVNSAAATTKLAFFLKTLSKKRIKVGHLSANLSIKERNSVLEEFSKEKIDILISSDALARGIDIPNVRYVISYDCPKFVKTYVHRIGRTGRAGKEGISLTLLTAKEVNNFNQMIISAGKQHLENLKFEEKDLQQYDKAFKKAVTSLTKHLVLQKNRSLKSIKIKKTMQKLAKKGKFVTSKKKLKKL